MLIYGNVLDTLVSKKYPIVITSIHKSFINIHPAGNEGDFILGVDKIAWPYILSGLWCAFFSLGYALLGIIYNVCIAFHIET